MTDSSRTGDSWPSRVELRELNLSPVGSLASIAIGEGALHQPSILAAESLIVEFGTSRRIEKRHAVELRRRMLDWAHEPSTVPEQRSAR